MGLLKVRLYPCSGKSFFFISFYLLNKHGAYYIPGHVVCGKIWYCRLLHVTQIIFQVTVYRNILLSKIALHSNSLMSR